MKIIITFISFFFSSSLFAQNTFEVEYKDDKYFSPFIVETQNQGFLLKVRTQDTDGVYRDEVSILDQNGKKLKSKKIHPNDTVTYGMNKIIATDTGFVGFGQIIYDKELKESDLWVVVIDKNLNITKELKSPLTRGIVVNAMDATLHKSNYFVAGYAESNQSRPYVFLGKIDIQKNTINIKDSVKLVLETEYVTNIMSFNDNLFVSRDGSLVEISDSLTLLKKPTVNFSSIPNKPGIVQGELVKLSDTEFIMAGVTDNPPFDLNIMKVKYPYIQASSPYIFGKKDTMDFPAITTTASAQNANNIYFGGTSNLNFFNKPDAFSWFLLANFDSTIKPRWQKYYGGDANYIMFGVVATSDGGCLMYGTKYYNNTESTTYLLKVNSLGQLLAADGTPLPEENIKVFPNPARDILNISASDSEAHLTIQCFDNQGRSVYVCDFNRFAQINVSEWPHGLYHCLIRDKNGAIVKTEKVVIGY
jgi:hypothetical protein